MYVVNWLLSRKYLNQIKIWWAAQIGCLSISLKYKHIQQTLQRAECVLCNPGDLADGMFDKIYYKKRCKDSVSDGSLILIA